VPAIYWLTDLLLERALKQPILQLQNQVENYISITAQLKLRLWILLATL
jgi:hypothetical protein